MGGERAVGTTVDRTFTMRKEVHTQRRAKVLVEKFFGNVASGIAYNPWKVVLVTTAVQLMLGLVLLTRSLNNDIEELYTPRNGVTDRQIGHLLPLYPDESGDSFSAIRAVNKPRYADVIISKTPGVNKSRELTDDDVRVVIQTVSDVEFPTRYYQANLVKVCALSKDKCVVSVSENANAGLFDQFKVDSYVIKYFDGSGVDVDASGENVTKPIKIRFYLRQDTKAYFQDSYLWQHAFVRRMKKWDNENITVQFSHSGSFLEEVGNDTFPDIRIFSLSVAIFITFLGFLVSGGDCVSKRMHIGRIAVVVVPLSVLGSWGFMSGIGMTFTNIVGVMPLFVLYHELNMAFSVLSGVSNNLDEPDGRERVVKAVQVIAAPSVVAFLAHLVPFAFTIISRYVALETFGIYTVATLVFNYFLHWTFFIGCLTIHEVRIDANRHSCTCKELPSRDDPEVEGRSCCFRCCCSGRKPSSREQVETCLERLPRRLFSRFLLLQPVKYTLTFIMVACVGLAIWKTMGLRIDTIQETDVTTKSYFRQFYESDIDTFVRRDVFTFTVSTKNMHFTKNGNVKELLAIYEDIKRLPGMAYNGSHFWLDEFHKEGQTYSSEYEFMTSLKGFLKNHDQFAKDIAWDDISNAIQEFRFYVPIDGLKTSEEALIAKDLVEDFVDDAFDDLDDLYAVDVKTHVPTLWLIDSYKAPVSELGRFAAIQLGMLFLLSMLFSNSIMTILHVLFWYSSVAFNIFACLSLLGVSINIVSVVNIMLGLCYGAEVIVYTILGYMHSEGTNNASRVYNVLQKVTPILYNLAFGTLLGLSVLVLEKSYVFLTVFKVIGVSVAVAWIHSFAFIPPTLAVVGIGRSRFFKSRIEKTFRFDIPTISGSTALSSDDKALAVHDKALAVHDKALAVHDKALAVHDKALVVPDKSLVLAGEGTDNKGFGMEEKNEPDFTKM